MIKLVLCDVDGTLIPLGEKGPSARTMRAIAQVQQAGIRFGLATGRDTVELMQLFGGNDFPFRTGILSNGKKIMVDGEIVRLSLIDNKGLARVVDALAEIPQTFVTAYPLNTGVKNTIYCMGATADELESWEKTYSFEGKIVASVPDEQIIGATIACAASEEVLPEVKRRALDACPDFDIVEPSHRWWDILPKGLNKGTALGLLLQELGLGVDEVMMFGDADNDLAILSHVENSVVVRDATPAAKAAARWHIGACEDDSVAQALEELAQSAKDGSTPSFMQE
ncbi:MAG: HAD family phosphatase [Atopobiaceae bacterium]|nr:HAD family phosphatase [Atopobiaceae bacterium]